LGDIDIELFIFEKLAGRIKILLLDYIDEGSVWSVLRGFDLRTG
jgi:hypothetical protein